MSLSSRVTLLVNILFCGLAFIPNSPVSACAVAFPFYVLLNNLSSHVYRNLRLGSYQDQTIGSSVINRVAIQFKVPGQSIMNPISTKLEDRDPEAGDITKSGTPLGQGTQGDIKQRIEV
jgi:hypothetical protein